MAQLCRSHKIWAACIGCTVLIALLFASSFESSTLDRSKVSETEVEHQDHRVLLLTPDEIAEWDTAEDLESEQDAIDGDFVEQDELNGLEASLTEVNDQMAAATSTCLEDLSDNSEPEIDGDYNATEEEIPCEDGEEIDELQLQLNDAWGEVETFLYESPDDILNGNMDKIYNIWKNEFKKDEENDPSQGNLLSVKSNAAHAKNALKAAIQENKRLTRKNNAMTMSSNGKINGNSGVTFGLNEWSDLSRKEFEEVMAFDQNAQYFEEEYLENERRGLMVVPEGDHGRHLQQTTFSWVDSGRLGRVVNQGSCGSCYLNAVVTEFETALSIATEETPLALSREQIKNCQKENYRTTSSTPRGCNGGWMKYSYEYIRRNWNAANQNEEGFGITLESVYPYVPSNIICGHNPETMAARAKVGYATTRNSSYKYIAPSETNFKKALADGPLVIALGASGTFGSYKSGVFTCGRGQYSINHAVVLVGWGEENGEKYWLIQNSWGTGWGDGGFIQLRRGLNPDGSEKSTRGSKGDINCGMTYYGAYQSKIPAKVDSDVQDCKGSWSEWSECSIHCSEEGKQTKTYNIAQEAANGGVKCPYPDGHTTQRQCIFAKVDKTDWSSCSKTCDGGTQTKTIQVANGACDDRTETRSCNTHICPDSCLIITNGPYSKINGNYHPSQGPNTRDRCSDNVPIYTNDKNNMKLFWYARSCSYGYWVVYASVGNRGYMWSRSQKATGTSPLAISRWWNNRNKMNIRAVPCDQLPVDCDGYYGKWGECSEACGGGEQRKTFLIKTKPLNGGKECPPMEETRACNTHSCGSRCMKVENARYSFLNGVYTGVVGGYRQSFCGGATDYPRYTKTVVRKYWWGTYKYTYDLAFYNNRCRYTRTSNPKYQHKGGYWALGRIYNRYGRVYMGSYDRSPYSWRNYLKTSDSLHPNNMGWEASAVQQQSWYRPGVTTVSEVACKS